MTHFLYVPIDLYNELPFTINTSRIKLDSINNYNIIPSMKIRVMKTFNVTFSMVAKTSIVFQVVTDIYNT